MENISLTTWDGIFVVDGNLAREWKDITDTINIHEMSHSYFGDSLVIRHFEHAWLKVINVLIYYLGCYLFIYLCIYLFNIFFL